MALNFPDSPTLNQIYTDTTSGFSYQWDGVVWKSYTAAAAANIRIIDDIESSFNGSTTTFALTSSGAPVTPVSPQQLRIVLGGIVQEPAVDYNVAGSNIIFTTAPATGLTFSGVLLGSAISPVGLASTGSVYYRQSYSPTGVQTTFTVSGGYRVGYLDVYHNGVKLVVTDDYTATNGTTFDLVTPANNGDTVEAVTFLYTQLYSTTGILDNLLVNGNATVTGITTLGNTVVGGGTTQLLVNGNARVTGILTVGTSSITLDGANNTINVGTLSISQSGISGGTPDVTARNISGVAATFTGNVSVGGTLTYEDVTNVDSVGLITARSGVNVTGGSVVISSGGLSVSGVTTVSAGSTSAPSISPNGDLNTGIFFPSADTIAFAEGGAEAARIDSSGRLLVGISSSRNVAAANQRIIQVESASGDGGISVVRNSNDDVGGRFVLGKSRGTSVGSNTVVQNGDDLGGLIFAGADGNDLQSWGAQILAEVDGTPGADDLPTRLVFSTTADGASSPTERLRIASTGAFGLSGTNYGTSGQVLTSQGSAAAPQWATPATGAMVFISSVTANNSTSVTFTSGIDSTYNTYLIVGSKIIPATDRVELQMRSSSNGGSSYDSGASDYRNERQRINASPLTQTNTDHMKVAGEIPSAGGSFGPLVAGTSFNIFFDKLTDTSYHKNFHIQTRNYFIDSGVYETYFCNAKRASTGAINALQFFFSSGNIASGIFTLYGLKNS